jgi:large subunit ribosomal protein L23
MSFDPYHIVKRPIITEKSNRSDEKLNQVVFEVDGRATKHQIKEAVEKIFKVKVLKVNTLRLRGKPLRRGLVQARRGNWKKAMVTLRPGDRIDFYEGA